MAELHLKVIFCLLTSPKFDFGEVEEAMIQVDSRHRVLIFFLLTSPKYHLGQFEKEMIQVVARDWKLIFPIN